MKKSMQIELAMANIKNASQDIAVRSHEQKPAQAGLQQVGVQPEV